MKRKPDLHQTSQEAVGPCPKCGRIPTWFNDVPLRAFCWGPQWVEHPEMTCVVPPPLNPYIKPGEKWPKSAFQWKTEKQFQALMGKVMCERLDKLTECAIV